MATNTAGSIVYPEAEHRFPPTSEAELDAAIADLSAKADDWISVDLSGRIALLDELIATTYALSDEWVAAAGRAKSIPENSLAISEEWTGGPYTTLRNLRLLKRTLEQVRDSGNPQLPGKVTIRPDGTTVVPVFPTDTYDKAIFTGFTAEVWMQDGVSPADVEAEMASIYTSRRSTAGKVALVLGAGNVASIGPMDALYKLFAEDEVVLLKMNPVNEYLGPFILQAFAALVDRGFLRVVYGGAAEGKYLTSHPGIASVHITGSDKTHDAIVFGGGKAGATRKAKGTPVLDKPISSELGNVSPVIVVPGPWTDKQLAYQATNIATMLVHNAGFNCIAARLLVTHGSWAKRDALLDAVRTALARIPQRAAYYPGAEERFEQFLGAHPEAERFGHEGDGDVPWTLVSGLDAANRDDICFTTEAFCGVFGEVPIEAPRDVAQYIRDAVAFCNDTVWGTLAVSIIVHPKSLKDPAVKAAVEEAIADLKYGTIVVNHWGGVGYGLVSPPWGAYPGHPVTDIQSGSGVVHNTYLLERTGKTVIRGPFTSPMTPPWFAGHPGSVEVNRRIAAFEADPGPSHLPGIVRHALKR